MCRDVLLGCRTETLLLLRFFISLSLSVSVSLSGNCGSLFVRKPASRLSPHRAGGTPARFSPVERVRKCAVAATTAACELHQHFFEISCGYRHRRQRREKCLPFVRGGRQAGRRAGRRERVKLANHIYLHQTRDRGKKKKTPCEHK